MDLPPIILHWWEILVSRFYICPSFKENVCPQDTSVVHPREPVIKFIEGYLRKDVARVSKNEKKGKFIMCEKSLVFVFPEGPGIVLYNTMLSDPRNTN